MRVAGDISTVLGMRDRALMSCFLTAPAICEDRSSSGKLHEILTKVKGFGI
jgi:hypothetical protein